MKWEKYILCSIKLLCLVHIGELSLPHTTNYAEPLILEHCTLVTSPDSHTVHFSRKKVKYKDASWYANEYWELGRKTAINAPDLRDYSPSATEIMSFLPEVAGKCEILRSCGSSSFSNHITTSGVVEHNIWIDAKLKISLFSLPISSLPCPIYYSHWIYISILKHKGTSEGHCSTSLPSDRWGALPPLLEIMKWRSCNEEGLP